MGCNKTIEFMFVGINMFWAGTQTHFSPSPLARVKMSSEKGPEYVYAQEHKLYYYY